MKSEFALVTAAQVREVLDGNHTEVANVVREAYLAHHAGLTINPHSSCLRFPEDAAARICSLPAALDGPDGTTGVKWIASFPKNICVGVPRASAVIILNDRRTGFPIACMEGSAISAARTASSAILAAALVCRGRPCPTRIGYVGAGLGTPYFHARQAIADDAVILHISLRDLSPAIITGCVNIVDDVEHCLQAGTSLHLAEGVRGRRDFVHASLGGLLVGEQSLPEGKPRIVSPFGLGMLDVALATHVYYALRSSGKLQL